MSPPMAAAPAHFIDLFRYDRWANRQVLAALFALAERAGAAPIAATLSRARLLLSHLLRAQTVWLGRVQGTEVAALPLWEEDDLDTLAQEAEEHARAWLDFLQQSSPHDLSRPIAYQNTKGRRFTSEVGEILTHLVNHATYHRAQIALLLREAGVRPPPTDYIVYARSAGSNARHPLHLMSRNPASARRAGATR